MKTFTRILFAAAIAILATNGLSRTTLAQMSVPASSVAAQPPVISGDNQADGETQDDQANQPDRETNDDTQASQSDRDHETRTDRAQDRSEHNQASRDRTDRQGKDHARSNQRGTQHSESPNGDGDGETNDDA